MNERMQRNPRRLQPDQVARNLYGSAFDHVDRDAVSQAMVEWTELARAERSFALGHLLFLNLLALTENNRLLRGALEELEEINDALQEVADDYFEADEGDWRDSDLVDDEPDQDETDERDGSDDREEFDDRGDWNGSDGGASDERESHDEPDDRGGAERTAGLSEFEAEPAQASSRYLESGAQLEASPGVVDSNRRATPGVDVASEADLASPPDGDLRREPGSVASATATRASTRVPRTRGSSRPRRGAAKQLETAGDAQVAVSPTTLRSESSHEQ